MNSTAIKSIPKLPPLWKHQGEALSRAGNKFALFFDPGCGKTRTAIELWKKSLYWVRIENKAAKLVEGTGKVIIFAPLNVCRNWQNELKEYCDIKFNCYLVAGQSKAQKLAALKLFATAYNNYPDFLICNIESLRSEDYLKILKTSGVKFIIVDEAHNFKTAKSLQTKGLLELEAALKPTHLYLLTGTPAPQGEVDLYIPFFLLGKTTDNFFIWRKKYFIDKNERRRGMRNYWPDYQCTDSSKKLFQQWLSEISITAKKNEVLDLPPLLRTNIYAEMNPEQLRHYETMMEFLFAVDKEGNELNAANFLSRSLRLQQILAGFLGDIPISNNSRIKALEAAIKKVNGEQFIIWTIFKATYRQIAALLGELGITYAFLTGEQSAQERQENMDAFQAGELKCLIAHPKAGGVGVNLTAASYSIHYTRSFSLTDDLQCEARNYRGGSERHERITRIDIITPNSLDEEIVAALKEKKTVQDFILGIKGKYQKQEPEPWEELL